MGRLCPECTFGLPTSDDLSDLGYSGVPRVRCATGQVRHGSGVPGGAEVGDGGGEVVGVDEGVVVGAEHREVEE